MLIPGLYLSTQFFTSPCLQGVPIPQRSFTRMLSRTGLDTAYEINSEMCKINDHRKHSSYVFE